MSSVPPQPALFLIRHARASGPRAGERDFDRTLDNMGLAGAGRMGDALRTRGWTLGDITASPARRCIQTADILTRAAASDSLSFEPLLYDGALDVYLSVLAGMAAQTDGNAPMTIVGHNPVIEQLAWECLGTEQATRALPAGFLPGMIIAIARKTGSAAGELPGRLVEVLTP